MPDIPDPLLEKKISRTETKVTTQVRLTMDNKGVVVVSIEDVYDGTLRHAVTVDEHTARFIRFAIDGVLRARYED